MVKFIKRNKNDLFNYRPFAFIFKNKPFLLAVRVFVIMIFSLAIYNGFANPEPTAYNFTTAIFWSLFWPFFMVITLGTIGSAFCGICPHGFLGKYITKFGLKLTTPKILQNPLIGLSFLIVFYWLVLYLFPHFLTSPLMSALFFFTFTLVAFILFFAFKDMSYCKYFCPIGSITASFSKVSPAWLATYQEECQKCTDFECAKACPYHLNPFNFDKKSSMQECKLCMECAQACEAVGLFVKKPASSLPTIKNQSKTSDIWTYILILWVASISMIFKNALGNSPIKNELPWKVFAQNIESRWNLGFDVEGLLVLIITSLLTLIFSVGSYKLVSILTKIEFKKIFLTAGYSLAPIVIFGGMAQTLPFFFTHYGTETLNGILSLFGSDFIPFGPFIEKSNPVLKVFGLLHFFGVSLGIWILAKRFKTLQITNYKTLTFIILSSFHIFYISMIVFVIYVFATKS